MSGTTRGGKLAAKRIKERYGDDFYKRIGGDGGKAGGTGGFWHAKYVEGNVERVRAAGARGGRISRRTKRNG